MTGITDNEQIASSSELASTQQVKQENEHGKSHLLAIDAIKNICSHNHASIGWDN